jgi:hypothetical protein
MTNPYTHDMKNKVYNEKTFSAVTQKAKRLGHDGVVFTRTFDSGERSRLDAAMKGNFTGETIKVVFDTKNIRSVNAAFDPAKRSSSNLLAGTAAATPIAAALLNMQTDDNTQ